jgi:hypothetical protein
VRVKHADILSRRAASSARPIPGYLEPTRLPSSASEKPSNSIQLYIFPNGSDVVVSKSPVVLCCAYAEIFAFAGTEGEKKRTELTSPKVTTAIILKNGTRR